MLNWLKFLLNFFNLVWDIYYCFCIVLVISFQTTPSLFKLFSKISKPFNSIHHKNSSKRCWNSRLPAKKRDVFSLLSLLLHTQIIIPLNAGNISLKMNKWKKRFSLDAQQFCFPQVVFVCFVLCYVFSEAGDIFLCKFSFSVVVSTEKCVYTFYVAYAITQTHSRV